jgi:hypothetical protein
VPSRTDKKCLCSVQVAPGEMQFLMSTAALPMVAKPIYGIISDSVYIKGAHRVPYLVIAGEDFMYLFSFFFFFWKLVKDAAIHNVLDILLSLTTHDTLLNSFLIQLETYV